MKKMTPRNLKIAGAVAAAAALASSFGIDDERAQAVINFLGSIVPFFF